MPKLRWNRHTVTATVRQEWDTTGDIRTIVVRRHGVGIYQAAYRLFGNWWEAAKAAGVPVDLFKNRLGAWKAEKATFRPGCKVLIPCRACGKLIPFLIRGGRSAIKCRKCSQVTGVTVNYEAEGWRVRTETAR